MGYRAVLSPTGSPGEETRQVRPAKVISRGGGVRRYDVV